MKNNNNRQRKVKGQIQNHNRKILYNELDFESWKSKSTLLPFLNTLTPQINKVRVVVNESDKSSCSEQRRVTITSSKRENNRQIVKMSYLPLLFFVLPVLLLSEAAADQSEVRATKLSEFNFKPYPKLSFFTEKKKN